MAKTVVGLFDRFEDAQAAVTDLVSLGIPREEISIARQQTSTTGTTSTTTTTADTDRHSVGSGIGAGAATGAVLGGAAALALTLIPGMQILAAGPIAAMLAGAGVGAAAGGLVGGLVNAGVPEDEAEHYSEGVRRGGTLVTLRTDDARADRAADIMNRHNAIDIDERAATWRRSGWTPRATTAAAATSATARPATPSVRSDAGRSDRTDWKADETGSRAKVPVVEERIEVGKREVRGGGVRVYTHVTERPVSEDVTLRQEKVNVERRPVDRPVTDADLRNLNQQQTIEVTETREVPVVNKQARVVEEVVVNKEVEQHKHTVRDTVKHTDVRVEQLGSNNPDFRDDDYRDNYNQTFAKTGMTYEQCRPAYQYGSQIAADRRYAGKDWSTVERDARTDWERSHAGEGTWDKIKDGVRYAYDRARAKLHA